MNEPTKPNPIENPIKVTCKSAALLPIDLILEFQKDLKTLGKKERDDLIRSIFEDGFMCPLFLWDDGGDYRLLDGHQRLNVLLFLRQRGWDIPLLPVDYIEALTIEDAKRKLLRISSQFGKFNIPVLQRDWVGTLADKTKETLRLCNEKVNLLIVKSNQSKPKKTEPQKPQAPEEKEPPVDVKEEPENENRQDASDYYEKPDGVNCPHCGEFISSEELDK